jgi:hypothetical protein
MNPIVHPWLTQSKEFAHDGLKGIGLEVNQDEQELLFWPRQDPLATPASGPLTGLTRRGLVGGIDSLISPREGGQQPSKLR